MDFAAMLAHEKKRRALEKKQAQDSIVQPVPEADGCCLPQLTRLSDDRYGAPSALWYCDSFLERDSLADLEKSIRTEHSPSEWLQLPKRKLLNLGGVPHPDGMIAEEVPVWLQSSVLERIARMGVFPEGVTPNQVLLNEYGPGMGIDPHADGQLYAPCVAIISLVTPAIIRLLQPPEEQVARGGNWGPPEVANIFLSPGSLFVFAEDAYNKMWHGIRDGDHDSVDSLTINRHLVGSDGIALGTAVPRGNRLSLTIRAVRKVAIPANEFLHPEQRAEANRRRAWWAKAVSEKNAVVPTPVRGVPTPVRTQIAILGNQRRETEDRKPAAPASDETTSSQATTATLASADSASSPAVDLPPAESTSESKDEADAVDTQAAATKGKVSADLGSHSDVGCAEHVGNASVGQQDAEAVSTAWEWPS